MGGGLGLNWRTVDLAKKLCHVFCAGILHGHRRLSIIKCNLDWSKVKQKLAG